VRGVSYLKQGTQDLTRSADFHLFLPVGLDFSFTDGSIDEPTELSGFKLPRWAFLFVFRGTFLDHPARLFPILALSCPGEQEKEVPFHMTRDISPTLLVTVYGLDRRSKQLGHLHLGLAQFLTNGNEFFAVHGSHWVLF
jgi:hypothetical protein